MHQNDAATAGELVVSRYHVICWGVEMKRRVFIGIPVGWVGFVLSCRKLAEQEELVPNGRVARRYKYAFISYAREDRREVKKRVQALRTAKIRFFQDILSLDPGDRWARRLYQEIDRCDLFILFWSRAAGNSEWVGREIERALQKRQASTEELPDIAPIALEALRDAPPPPVLAAFHFDCQALLD
jgi:TIR domain